MEYWVCLERRKDKNGRIIAYNLQSLEDKAITEWIDPNSLKRLIISNKCSVTNLKLGIDGKLREQKSVRGTKAVPQTDFLVKKIEETKKLMAKASLVGMTVTRISTDNNTFCYLLSKSFDKHILYIPDDVKVLNDSKAYKEKDDYTFANALNRIQGHLEIVGGRGLESTSLMFYRVALKTLDLQYLDTSNVTNMHGMFKKFFLDSTLDLSTLNTDKVKCMDYMFYHALIPNINFRGFNTSKVTNMCAMFAGLQFIRRLDLTSFSIESIKQNGTHYLLKGCQAGFVDLSSMPMTKEAFFGILPDDTYVTIRVANQELVDWYMQSSLMKQYKLVTITC